MLRTNLSTRPFYNVRAVGAILLGALAIVLAITAFNAIQIVRLTSSERTRGASAAAAETEAERLRAEAVRIRGQINPQELAVVAGAAREANVLIDQRTFSWTELFTQLETTLPDDVRITGLRPRADNDRFVLDMAVQARQAADLDAFMEALEATAGFRDVLSVQERVGTSGLLEAIVQGTYVPPARDAAAAGGTP